MNAFLDLAERQIAAPPKSRLRAAEKRAARKAAEERAQFNAAWQRWRNEQREKLLAGPYGEQFQRLIGFLDDMGLHDSVALIGMVEAEWKHADADMRFAALSLIDSAIITLRERHGLPTFDDPLPDEAPNVFQIIHEVLA